DFDLLQSQSILIQNQEIGFEIETIDYRSINVPDLLCINVKYQEWEDNISTPSEKELSTPFPIITTGTKNFYLLPVKGAWHYNRSYDWDFGHRVSYSQEFAFDFQQYNSQYRIKNNMKVPNSEFPHYGASVYAVAEGTVTIVGDKFPENDVSDEIIMIDPEKQRKFIAQFGFNRTLMGNHVMIAHPNGEYSLYCHMIPGKMCVKEGDTVVAGQQIGQLGNSGFSGFPHLHFQIVDGADPLNSRGIPCRFRNITDEYAQKIEYLQINNQYIHTDTSGNEYQ
ncbi:MAG: M23 family metallopeptidase, partial [Candidatus Heimdallarchaeota archaeon]|nr:M23 family metallopeptidase [Candidatus Heimdallarchaeota archaeon]